MKPPLDKAPYPRDPSLTNLSGSFQFDDEVGLRGVAEQLRRQGLVIEIGAVRLFPADGSGPIILE